MTRTKQWKITLIVLCAVLVLSLAAVLLSSFSDKTAFAEPITVSIHNNGNGTVTWNEQKLEATDTDKTIEATVTEEGTLEVKAEGTTVSGDDGDVRYIFQFWSTDAEGSNVVSVKANDVFSYEEAKQFTTGLYANFVQGVPEEKIEENKIKISYDDRLGEVYLFLGKEKPTQEEILKHGILIPDGVATEMPFKYVKRVLGSHTIETISASEVMIAAIPKTNVQSTLDPSRTTTSQFMGWSAEFAGGMTSKDATFYNQALPPYMKSGNVGTKDNPDGTYEIYATAIPVTNMWFSQSVSGGSQFFTVSSKQTVNDSNNKWYWNKFDKTLKYGDSLYVRQQSISAEFKEISVVPTLTLTPTVGEEIRDQQTSTDLRTTVSIPYGNQNSLRVVIGKLPDVEKQLYEISVQRARDLSTGEFTSDDTTKYEETEGGYLFNVDNINVNTKIIIKPDYGSDYFVNPIVIDVMLTEEIEKIVADDSAQIKTSIDEESEQSGWYLDPQFNSNSGNLSFTSKNSYPETVSNQDREFVSNLHFQVTGSGVFTFEFYLDGERSWGWSYAMYKLDSPVTVDDFGENGAERSSSAKMLATGNSNFFISADYYEPTINDTKQVVRLSGSTGWCVATIQITAEAEQTTDIYVAHASSEYMADGSEGVQNAYMKRTVMSVRNVGFYQGQSNVSWSIYGDNQSYGSITAQVNGEDIQSGSSQSSGTRITFAVEKNVNYFYGWSDGEKLLSTEETFSYTVHGSNGAEASTTNIYAVVAPEGTYYFQNGGKFYLENQLQDALNGAKSNPRVYILQSVDVSGEITVPKNAQLILPYDADGNYTGNGGNYKNQASAIPSWKTSGKEWSDPYITFTFEGNMTVNGTFYIGAVNHYEAQEYSGLTSGAYSQLINNGAITVGNGGLVDVYGFVTGSGSIEVENGAKIAQPFLILDYSGGTNTLALYQLRQTPFNRYAMINIQCAGGITIHYGGELLGHASLYAMGGIFLASAPVISYATREDDTNARGLIMLTEGATAEIVYTEDEGIDNTANSTKWIGRTKLTITGGAIAKFMALNVGFTISTEDVDAFAVPYNFEIELNSGNYNVNGNFKLMPGSSLTVNSGATLNINSNFFVYDGLVQSQMSGKYYPTATELHNAGYKTNATFVVNGKLNIGEKATFFGVVQTTDTTGTAQISVARGATISGTIADGGLSSYDCNYMEYKSSLRLYDKVRNVLTSVPAGEDGKAQKAMSFVSTWAQEDNQKKWELPQTTLMYDSGSYNSNTAENHLPHDGGNTFYIEGKTNAVSGLVGSWQAVHSNHVYDWTPVEGEHDKLTGDVKQVKLTRQCTELGCNEHDTKQLLSVPDSLGDLVYSGTDVTEEQLQGLFDKLFSGVEAEFSSFEARNVKNGYTVTVVLANDYWLDGGKYVGSKQLSFNVTQKEITVTATDQSSTYGEDNAIDQQAFDAPELCGTDTLSLEIDVTDGPIKDQGTYTLHITLTEGGSNANYKVTLVDGTYTVNKREITVQLSSKEREYDGKVPDVSEVTASLKAGSTMAYDEQLTDYITISITVAAKDVATYTVTATAKDTATNYNIHFEDGKYTITKKQVTVTADNQTSVFGEQPKTLTYKVVGLVETDDETTFRETYIKITCEVTESTGEGRYDIVVSLKDAEPLNYKVNFVNGNYNVTNATFKDLQFNSLTVTYDGEMHDIKVTGAPDGAQIVYTVDGKPFTGAKDFGNYEITATITLDNYDAATRNATLTINKLAITVELPVYSREYNGEVPSASELTAKLASGSKQLGKGDDLKNIVTLSIENAAKDVGSYKVKGVQNKEATNYTVSFGADGSYEVTAVKISVKIKPQTKVYDGTDGKIENTKDWWEITSGNTVGNEELAVTLELVRKSDNKQVDSYDIQGSCSDNNYQVDFGESGKGAYTITKATLTVTAEAKNSTYGDQPVQLTSQTTGKIDDGSTVEVGLQCEVELSVTTPVKAGGYVITVTVTNKEQLHNYDVKEVNGVYTVDPRPVTVTIMNQEATYDYQHNYSFVETKWQPDNNVVNGDELEVTLNKPTMTDAGTYQITGTYNGTNYTVTFAGSYEGGTAGTYTVHKKQLTDEEVMFILNVNGDTFNPQEPQPYTYNGDPLPLTANAFLLVDEHGTLSAKVDPAAITESKVYTVTVTIEDTNYEGSKTFTLTVRDAEGYTPNLKAVVDYLEEHYSDLTADNLTAEDFDKVKDIVAKLATLEEEERKSGESKLEQYVKVVNAWNDTEVDEGVVATAKAIADAPLKGLMGTVVAMNVLLAAMYVVAKGGLR